MVLKLLTLLLAATTLIPPSHGGEGFSHRTLLYAYPHSSSSPQPLSRSSLPWGYLNPRSDSNESGGTSDDAADSTPAAVPASPEVTSVPESVESEEPSSSSAEDLPPPQQSHKVQMVPVPILPGSGYKGDRGVIVKKPVVMPESEEDDTSADRELSPAAKDFITFSYYPINQVLDNGGSVVYEIQDADLRTARGGGKGKKKGCKKKGKKGKGKKGKGKKGKKGKKGCSLKGGWWYYYDKKHGYVSGRWGTPPPKGLEREHYWHNYGKWGHGYGQGYDGHGHMGWKLHGWGGYGGGAHGGHHHGGHHGGQHGGHLHGGGHGGWGWQQPHHTHYGWGWAEKVKGWGWR